MKRVFLLSVTLCLYFLTGAPCLAATYYSTGYDLEQTRYFVTYGEAKNYNFEYLSFIVSEHNHQVDGGLAEPKWEVYDSTTGDPVGDIVEFFEARIRVRNVTEGYVKDPDGEDYMMTAYWSSAPDSCGSGEYETVFVEPVIEAPVAIMVDSVPHHYQCTGTVVYNGEVLDTKIANELTAELAERQTRNEFVNERYPRGCKIIQVSSEVVGDLKGGAYGASVPFADAAPGVDLDGVSPSLGGHYYYRRSQIVYSPTLMQESPQPNWDMGYGWQSDFNIRLGRVGIDKDTLVLEMRGSQYFFYAQSDGSYIAENPGDVRVQVLNDGKLVRIRLGDTAFEFDMPEPMLSQISEAECGEFDYPRPDLPFTDCQAGDRPVMKTTRIVSEEEVDGIYFYKGFSLDYTYQGGLLKEVKEADTGELYTFYYVNEMLEKVTDKNGEIQFSFTYNPTTYNLETRTQKGYGTTTFSYYILPTETEEILKWKHLLVGIERPGGVTTQYDIHATNIYTNELRYFDALQALTRLVHYREAETAFSGPQVVDTYIPAAQNDGINAVTQFMHPLQDDFSDYTFSFAFYPERVEHEDYGWVTRRDYQDENNAAISSYDDEGKVLWSQVMGRALVDEKWVPDGTYRTTKNEWDDNGNLKRTVSRDLTAVPDNTWDVEYDYDQYNRVTHVNGLDGVTQVINYVAGSVSPLMVQSTWTARDSVIINKTVYEYYPESADPHQRFRLYKKQNYDNETLVAEAVYDYVAEDAEDAECPQNVGRLWKTTYTEDSSFEKYSYDCNGLKSHRNRSGATVSYDRDDLGRPEHITSPANAVTDFTYYPDGRLWTKTLPSGGMLTYHYDAQKRWTQTDYPDEDKSVESATYYAGDLVKTTTSRMGLVSTYHRQGDVPQVSVDGFTYDSAVIDGSLQGITTEDGILVHYTYDGFGRVKTRTDGRGQTLTFLYDDYGRQYKTLFPEDGTFIRKEYYDEKYGRPLKLIRDRLEGVTNFEYDDFGRLTARVLANGLREETVYDGLSRPVMSKMIDMDDNVTLVTNYVPDGFPLTFDGKPTRIVYPDDAFESFQYENGLLRYKTDRAGKTWEYKYTDAAQPDQLIAPDGLGVVADYDYIPSGLNAGRVEKVTSADSVTRTFEYDTMGRLWKTIMPDSTSTYSEVKYSPAGPDYMKDRAGIVVERQYDKYGRLFYQTEPNNADRKTFYYYNNLSGDLTDIVDAETNQTTMEYDTEGRLKFKRFADTSEYSYQYFINEYDEKPALLVKQTDAKNQVINSYYNQMNKLVKIDYPSDPDVTYEYTKFGDLKKMIDATGTTNWDYDGYGRLKSEDGPFDNDLVGYGYNDVTDPARRRSTLELNGSALVAYSLYDAMGRLKTVNDFSFDYYRRTRQVDEMYRNAMLVEDNGYDTLGRFDSTINKTTASAMINSYVYGLDDSDRRDKVTYADSSYVKYGQDYAGRLEVAERHFADGRSDHTYDYGFDYDEVGNPLLRYIQGRRQTYTFNELNQPEPDTAEPFQTINLTGKISPSKAEPTVTVNGKAASVDSKGYWLVNGLPVNKGSNAITIEATDKYSREVVQSRSFEVEPALVSFGHDANGNMTEDGLYSYVWNEADRLTKVEPLYPVEGDRKLSFVYDGLGRRRVKNVSVWDGYNWQFKGAKRFVYDGFKQVAELDGSNTVKSKYAWLGDRLLSVSQGGNTYYPSFDGSNNITAYTDASGAIVARYDYSPFGRLVKKSGDKADIFTFRFSSEAYDDETDLVYYNYRYYNPEFGRWLNRDPIGEAGGINLYAMANNNPVDNVDQLGLMSEGFRFVLSGSIISGTAKVLQVANLAENVITRGKGVRDDPLVIPFLLSMDAAGKAMVAAGIVLETQASIEKITGMPRVAAPPLPTIFPGPEPIELPEVPPYPIDEDAGKGLTLVTPKAEPLKPLEGYGQNDPIEKVTIIPGVDLDYAERLRALLSAPMLQVKIRQTGNIVNHYRIYTDVDGKLLDSHTVPDPDRRAIPAPIIHTIYDVDYLGKSTDVIVEVPDEFLVQEFQEMLLKKRDRGRFSKKNNCITDVFHCLRAGGFDVKYDLNLYEGEKIFELLLKGKPIPPEFRL